MRGLGMQLRDGQRIGKMHSNQMILKEIREREGSRWNKKSTQGLFRPRAANVFCRFVVRLTRFEKDGRENGQIGLHDHQKIGSN